MNWLAEITTLLGFIPAILRVTTPILLAALGVLISERAGVLNIGAEASMLAGAFAGVVLSAWTGSAWAGLLGAIVAGACFGGLLSLAYHVLKTDLILSGIALNMAASAGTTLCLFLLTGDKGISSSLQSGVLPNISLPFIEDIPVLGPILSGHNILTYAAVLAVPLVAILLERTAFGIHLRATGENPEAAAVAGIRVVPMQATALLISGAFAGVAGAFLSMGYVSWFAQNMSAGRGFIALAAQVMGQGSAFGTFAAALLLGFADELSIILQGVGFPHELVQTLPYIVPCLALAFHALRYRRRRQAH